jgi:hypothetical protein
MTALAAPTGDEATKVIRNPTKVFKRFYGEKFCNCMDDCKSTLGQLSPSWGQMKANRCAIVARRVRKRGFRR